MDIQGDFAVYVNQHKAERTLCSMTHEIAWFILWEGLEIGSCVRLHSKVLKI